MAKVNFGKMSYAELLEFADSVDEAIANRKAEEARKLKAQLAAIAQESGFDLSELVNGRKKRAGKAGPGAAPRYRNPEDVSQTWTGRGRKPNWLVDALERGEALESFEI